jgi:hypothetical protein
MGDVTYEDGVHERNSGSCCVLKGIGTNDLRLLRAELLGQSRIAGIKGGEEAGRFKNVVRGVHRILKNEPAGMESPGRTHYEQ